jgi:hypothetical protein
MAGKGVVGILRAIFSAETGKFSAGIKKAKDESTEFQKRMRLLSRKLNKMGRDLQNFGKAWSRNVSAPIAAGVALVGTLGIKFGQAADEIDKFSKRTGFSTDAVQEFRFVTNQLGGDLSTIERTAKAFQSRLGQIERGTGEAATSARALGINLRDNEGNLKTSEVLYKEVISALAGVSNETERAIHGNALLGRSWADLNPILSAGVGGIQEQIDKAHELGLVLNKETIESGVKFNDTVGRMREQAKGLANVIGASLVPVIEGSLVPLIDNYVIPGVQKLAALIQKLGEWFSNLPAPVRGLITVLGTLLVVTGPIIFALGKIMTVFGAITKVIGPLVAGIKAIGGALALLSAPIWLKIAALVALIGIIALVARNFKHFREFVMSVWDRIVIVVIKAVDKIAATWEFFGGVIDKVLGTNMQENFQNFRQGLRGMQKEAEERLDGREVKTFGELFGNVWTDVTNIVEGSIARVKGWFSGFGQSADDVVEKNDRATDSFARQRREIEKLAVAGLHLQAVMGGIPLKLAKIGESGETVDTMFQGVNLTLLETGSNFQKWEHSMAVLDGMTERYSNLAMVAVQSMQLMAHSAVVTGQSIEALGNTAMTSALQFVRAKMYEAVASYIASAFATQGIFALATAGIGAAVVTALFNSAMGSIGIPSFAQGGAVYGPTVALAGEYPGASRDPEIFARQSQLQSLIGGGGKQAVHITVDGRLRGTDIELQQERVKKIMSKAR